MYQDFPFTIREVAYLLNLRIRHKNAVSLDADCPFCGETKGKLNLNLKKNVFKCNRCGESGGMLSLYGKIYGVDNQTACREIKDALGKNEQAPSYQVRKKMIAPREPEIENAPPAPDAVRHKTYSMFFSMLVLADTHRQNLLGRGFTERQIEENGYKSTPVFGYKKLTRKLLEAGCTVKGVPGFYQDRDGEWTIHFSNKSSGFLVPVRNMDHMIVGAQIRLDHPYDGRKYIWLSSTNLHTGKPARTSTWAHPPEAPSIWRAVRGKRPSSLQKGRSRATLPMPCPAGPSGVCPGRTSTRTCRRSCRR